MVWAAGFEPAMSRFQGERLDQASLRPVHVGRGSIAVLNFMMAAIIHPVFLDVKLVFSSMLDYASVMAAKIIPIDQASAKVETEGGVENIELGQWFWVKREREVADDDDKEW